MGYLVETTGRVVLPREREKAAVDALTVAMQDRDGWFHPDEDWPVITLATLASFAGATIDREDDWLVLATDEEGDPKWSAQATAFYVELASWVREGTVHLSGEDGMDWSYSYAEGRVTQSGINGWDGANEPFGEPVEDEPPAPAPQRRGWFRRR